MRAINACAGVLRAPPDFQGHPKDCRAGSCRVSPPLYALEQGAGARKTPSLKSLREGRVSAAGSVEGGCHRYAQSALCVHAVRCVRVCSCSWPRTPAPCSLPRLMPMRLLDCGVKPRCSMEGPRPHDHCTHARRVPRSPRTGRRSCPRCANPGASIGRSEDTVQVVDRGRTRTCCAQQHVRTQSTPDSTLLTPHTSTPSRLRPTYGVTCIPPSTMCRDTCDADVRLKSFSAEEVPREERPPLVDANQR